MRQPIHEGVHDLSLIGKRQVTCAHGRRLLRDRGAHPSELEEPRLLGRSCQCGEASLHLGFALGAEQLGLGTGPVQEDRQHAFDIETYEHFTRFRMRMSPPPVSEKILRDRQQPPHRVTARGIVAIRPVGVLDERIPGHVVNDVVGLPAGMRPGAQQRQDLGDRERARVVQRRCVSRQRSGVEGVEPRLELAPSGDPLDPPPDSASASFFRKSSSDFA
jgi:hypothetical protein